MGLNINIKANCCLYKNIRLGRQIVSQTAFYFHRVYSVLRVRLGYLVGTLFNILDIGTLSVGKGINASIK